jgi:hypothetical protein
LAGEVEVKPLLTYIVTQSVLARFQRTLVFQKAHFPEAFDQYDKLVLTDLTAKIDVGLPVVRRNICPGGKYSMPIARNAAFKIAEEHGCEWHFDGDADRVIADFPEKFPEPGLGFVSIYNFLKPDTEKDVLERYRAGKINFYPSSFFVTHRDVFTKFKFCEEFSGYGFDDFDFTDNICANVNRPRIPVHGFHLWHDDRIYEGFSNYEGFVENGKLFDSRKKKPNGN